MRELLFGDSGVPFLMGVGTGLACAYVLRGANRRFNLPKWLRIYGRADW